MCVHPANHVQQVAGGAPCLLFRPLFGGSAGSFPPAQGPEKKRGFLSRPSSPSFNHVTERDKRTRDAFNENFTVKIEIRREEINFREVSRTSVEDVNMLDGEDD